MESLKTIGLALGLGESVTEAQITSLFKNQEGQISTLNAEIASLKTQEVERRKTELKTLLDHATTENRIDGTQRSIWEALFKADYDSAKNLLDATVAKVKLADAINVETNEGGVKKYEGMTFSELRTKAPAKLLALKGSNKAMFEDLYKSEFGKEYQA